MIGLATRVPIRSVRQRLVDIADERTSPRNGGSAALALGRAGDEQAAAPLLGCSTRSPKRPKCWRLIDTSAVVDEIEQRWKSETAASSLAVALAKRGRADALVAELERLSSDPDLAEEWLYTDETTELEQALARTAPLPDEVRGAVDREWSGWFARHLVSDVLFSPPAQKPADSSTWKTYVSEDLPAAERELVRKALGSGLPEHDRLSGRTGRQARRRPLSGARPGARAPPLRLAARVRAPRAGRQWAPAVRRRRRAAGRRSRGRATRRTSRVCSKRGAGRKRTTT